MLGWFKINHRNELVGCCSEVINYTKKNKKNERENEQDLLFQLADACGDRMRRW